MPVLRRFHNIETISYKVQSFPNQRADMSMHDIGQTLAQSPDLRTLSLRMSDLPVAYHNGLEQMMEPLEKAGVRLRLRNLTLTFCESPLAVLPHLQHLKVLSMCVGDENTRETRKFMNEFWRGMTDMNVELSEIIVNHVPDALVDYLQHYHGLEFFRFDTFDDHLLRAGIRGMFATCVVELYCEGLPSHASTLKKVMIRTEYQNDWGWSPQIQPGLAKCTALEYLGIGVTFFQLLQSCPSEEAWTSERRPPIVSFYFL